VKYMGSKRAMLANGLGEALGHSVMEAKRVLDLFSGSGAVAWHIAETYEKEVVASDLQEYSVILAASVIERATRMRDVTWGHTWIGRASSQILSLTSWRDIEMHQAELGKNEILQSVEEARSIIFGEQFPITKAYGGYYFSPWQALWIDALRTTLPQGEMRRNVALAALIQAASQCAAAPGHTAQPFKPNQTAGPFLIEAWKRDLPRIVMARLTDIASKNAKKVGRALCCDALAIADEARPGDLAFVDPPYSSVHYSRFYHVLETVARGKVGAVSGVGRYPPSEERPTSAFSIKTKASNALGELLALLARRRAGVVITFPAGLASNGLSGDDVKEIAMEHFYIKEEKVSSRFSTMGGNDKHRAARHYADELILTLSG